MSFPYARGERPYRVIPRTDAALKRLRQVPGAKLNQGGFDVALDLLPLLQGQGDLLVHKGPDPIETLPGLARYRELGLHEKARLYQGEAVMFLAPKRSALLCDPCQTGKTFEAVAAAVAAGHKRVLVLTTGFIALNWMEQLNKFIGADPLLALGRGEVARSLCEDCPRVLEGCKKCRYTGTRPEHDFGPEVYDWVICPYDCLRPHEGVLADGRRYERTDLPGRADELHQTGFDLVILDESHLLSGSKSKRSSWTKRAVGRQSACWGLTGTPVRGFTRTLHSQLDIITGGLFGTRRQFDERYCGGHYNEHGWSANGRSPLVDVELAPRLAHLMLKRERKDLLPHMPQAQPKVIRVDPPSGWKSRLKLEEWKGKPSAAVMGQACQETFDAKWPAVSTDALQFLAEGAKVVLYTWHRDTAREAAQRLESIIKGRRGAVYRENQAKVFCAEGTNPQARNRMAKKFSEHQGAGVWASTMEASMLGVALRGAVAFLYADLHWSPDVIEQSAERASQAESTGVTLMFYIANGTIDESILPVLLPKLKTQHRITKDQTAARLEEVLGGPKETLQEAWARHVKHLRARRAAA